jgi:hypothetical protein
MDINFSPDTAPDENFQASGYQARLAAHYLRTLKDEGLSEHEACELTREWICACVDAGKDEE